MMVSTGEIEGSNVVYQILEEIAGATGVDIRELPPLYDTIDPDALDAFLRCSEETDAHPERSVEFSYCGYLVTVVSTGQVHLHPKSGSTASLPSR